MGQVVVIGGGAAGMMAAYAASQNGHEVMLLEKNEKLGKKVYITGKGRCNVTNACDTNDFFGQVIHNPKSMYSAVYGFDSSRVMEFMEENGCMLKTERGMRVFPVSDHSSDVIRACAQALRKNRVEIRLETKVLGIEVNADGEKSVLIKNGERIKADAVIVATGGLSYASTGSDGDGFRFAKDFQMEVTPMRPALVPFEVAQEWCSKLQGLSLKNVTATLEADGKVLYQEMGEMLFTHFGISGPLVLSASSYYADYIGKCGKKGKNPEKVRFHIDLKPALSVEMLDKRVLRDFEQAMNKKFKNALDGLFPAKLLPIMIDLSGIEPEKPVHEINRKERLDFVNLIKDLSLEITGTRGYNEAIITQGGISMKEINPSTMESKKQPGVYFAGEVLDVDALTGGYNLQIAWSTGHLAGESAAMKLQQE